MDAIVIADLCIGARFNNWLNVGLCRLGFSDNCGAIYRIIIHLDVFDAVLPIYTFDPLHLILHLSIIRAICSFSLPIRHPARIDMKWRGLER